MEKLNFIQWAIDNGHSDLHISMEVMNVILDYQKHIKSEFKNNHKDSIPRYV